MCSRTEPLPTSVDLPHHLQRAQVCIYHLERNYTNSAGFQPWCLCVAGVFALLVMLATTAV